MISYKIVSNRQNRKPDPATKAVSPDDPDYKEVILERLYNRTRIRVDHPVQIKGTNKVGKVKEIIKDYKRIVWHNNKPKFIIVEMDDGKEYLVGEKQLKLLAFRSKK